jgi:hypothetical protein
MSLDWNVRTQDLVAFHIPIKRTFFGWFEAGARVAEGTRALLFDGGAYVGDVPAGTWTHSDLAERLGVSRKSELSVVLVDTGDLELPLSFETVHTADGHPLDIDLTARLRVHEAQVFFHNLLKQKPRVTLGDLGRWLAPRLDGAVRVAVGRFPLQQLQTPDRDLRLLLESDLDRELKLELRRAGLDLVHLSWFRARNERLEALQARRVDLSYSIAEHGQDKAEEELRRERRVFDEDGRVWEENQDVQEATARLKAWNKLAEIARNKKVLGAGDVRELKDALDEQAAQYAKSNVLRERDLTRFREDVEWDGYLKGLDRAEERADKQAQATLADRARKQVLEKIRLAQEAELQSAALQRAAEVEATKLRVAALLMGEEADVKRLGLKIEHELNEQFYPGKARELELQEQVEIVARRAAQQALTHEIDMESMQHDALITKVRRELGIKGEVSEFTRGEALKDVELKVSINDIARGQAEKDFVAGLNQQKAMFDEEMRQHTGKADVEDYVARQEFERTFEAKRKKWELQQEKLISLANLDKDMSQHDEKMAKEAMLRVQEAKDKEHRRKEEEEARKAKEQRELKELDNSHEVNVLDKKLGHEQVIKKLDVEDSADMRRNETEQIKVLGSAASADHIYAVKNAASASSYHEKEARVAEAKAKHSAEVADARLEAAQAAHADAAAERRRLDDLALLERQRMDEERRREADRLERVVGNLAAGGQQQAAALQVAQAAAQRELLDETRKRAEKMEQVSDRVQDRMVDVANNRNAPAGGVNVKVSVNQVTCGSCGTGARPGKSFCPSCGSALG